MSNEAYSRLPQPQTKRPTLLAENSHGPLAKTIPPKLKDSEKKGQWSMLAYIMGESIANQVNRAISSVERKRRGIKSKNSISPQDAGDVETSSSDALTSSASLAGKDEKIFWAGFRFLALNLSSR